MAPRQRFEAVFVICVDKSCTEIVKMKALKLTKFGVVGLCGFSFLKFNYIESFSERQTSVQCLYPSLTFSFLFTKPKIPPEKVTFKEDVQPGIDRLRMLLPGCRRHVVWPS